MKSAVLTFIFLLTAVNGASLRTRDSSHVELEPHDTYESPLPPQRRRLTRKNGDIIPGSYIVTMNESMEPDGKSRKKDTAHGDKVSRIST
jgi:hypothetical protein